MPRGKKKDEIETKTAKAESSVQLPKVSCITVCNRAYDYFNMLGNFRDQDYENKELILVLDEGMPPLPYMVKGKELHMPAGSLIADKRNYACEKARGEILVIMDSDDWYAKDWITKTVSHLMASDAVVTGVSECVFENLKEKVKYMYRYGGSQPYVVGASMVFYKSEWQKLRYKSMNIGEDTDLLMRMGKCSPCGYNDGFVARLHGKNTASHKAVPIMKRIF